MSNYRHEIKFIINKKHANILKQRLMMLMDVDQNGKNGYFIRSLYFDTMSSDAYYDKIDGVSYREKYRIRMYNQDDNYIRLEKKIKNDNLTLKEQTIITKKECLDIINNDIDLSFKDGLLKEFLIDVKTKNLVPSVIVDYDRFALTYPISDVRITFDYNIKSGIYNYNLFGSDNDLKILDENTIVLEVKYNEVLPEFIDAILKSVPTMKTAFSKFAMCRGAK